MHYQPSSLTYAVCIEDTIKTFTDGSGFRHKTNAMRTACHYIDGETPPNYPVPSLLGVCVQDTIWVCLYASDADRPNPLITWYNESLNLPLPSDHAIPVEWN